LIRNTRAIVTAMAAMALCGSMAGGAPMRPDRLCDGNYGKALSLKGGRKMIIPSDGMTTRLPVTFECWFRLDSSQAFNVLLSQAPKSGAHWELFSPPGEGRLVVYVPQLGQADHVGASEPVADGRWHFCAVRFQAKSVELYVDGNLCARGDSAAALRFDDSSVYVGGIALEVMSWDGAIDELHITRSTRNLEGYIPSGPARPDNTSLRTFYFESISEDTMPDETPNSTARAVVIDSTTRPLGARFMDEIQDKAFFASSLYGDEKVEDESRLPARIVKAGSSRQPAKSAKPNVISLSGEWLMKDSDPGNPKDAFGSPARDSGGLKLGYHRPACDRTDWHKVSVPTSVQSALVKLGELEDPHWNSNTYDELNEHGEPKDQFWASRRTRIEQKDWWFAKSFVAPKSWRGKAVRLYFDGIDYSGSVYLNGNSLGHHEGMFGGPTRDVSKLLNYGEENVLVVRLDKTTDSWYGRLKGSPGFGWHYGHLISTGIWRDVTLTAVPAVEISSPYVVTKSIKGKKAVLQIEYYIDSRNPEPTRVSVTGTIKGANFKSDAVNFACSVEAPYGRSRYRTEVTLSNARLWWPMIYGDQNLYELTLTAGSSEGKSFDGKTTKFGVRTIEMLPAFGAVPETDHRWQFVINGRSMFIKGANWCWFDVMLEGDAAKYEKILELARRGGIQMFRAWGGGIIETDTFYNKCDEKGLMVYQEFPFCWGPPDFPATNAQMEDQQVSTVVKRLRNHPSLIMWGGGNENVPGENNDEGLFLVGRRCRQFDPSRPFHRTDPWGGSSHNWSVFHAGQPMDSNYYSFNSVFYGEYGLPSMTNRSSCLKYMPESELQTWPLDESRHGWIQHMNQFSSRDPIKVLKYADYGPVSSWDDYIEYSQMAQGDWMRFAAEGQRACSGLNKTGFWFYKFTDLFPGHSWAVVDYYGTPKISYYRAKQTCAPRCAFAVYPRINWEDGEKFQAKIHVANDTAATLAGAKVVATVFGSDLSAVWSKEYAVADIDGDQRLELDAVEVAIPAELCRPFILAVTMRDSKGELLSDQWYWLNYQAKTDRVKEIEKLDSWQFPEDRFADAYAAYAEVPEARLLSLPPTSLSVAAKMKGREGTFTVTNNGSVPAFNVLFDNYPDGYGDFLDDNSFFLRPGETREITFDLGAGSSIDEVTVRAWNAKAVAVK